MSTSSSRRRRDRDRERTERRSSSSGRRKMVINMTTTIMTEGTHNGLVVHSGFVPSNRDNVEFSFAAPSSLSQPLSIPSSLSYPDRLPLPQPLSDSRDPLSRSHSPLKIRELPPSHAGSQSSVFMSPFNPLPPPLTRPLTPPSSFRDDSPPDEFIRPYDFRLNTFEDRSRPSQLDGPMPRYNVSTPTTTPLSRSADSFGELAHTQPNGVRSHQPPNRTVLDDAYTTQTTIEVFRAPMDGTGNFVLPPGPHSIEDRPHIIKAAGPAYEKWENTRTDTVISDPAFTPRVQAVQRTARFADELPQPLSIEQPFSPPIRHIDSPSQFGSSQPTPIGHGVRFEDPNSRLPRVGSGVEVNDFGQPFGDGMRYDPHGIGSGVQVNDFGQPIGRGASPYDSNPNLRRVADAVPEQGARATDQHNSPALKRTARTQHIGYPDVPPRVESRSGRRAVDSPRYTVPIPRHEQDYERPRKRYEYDEPVRRRDSSSDDYEDADREYEPRRGGRRHRRDDRDYDRPRTNDKRRSRSEHASRRARRERRRSESPPVFHRPLLVRSTTPTRHSGILTQPSTDDVDRIATSPDPNHIPGRPQSEMSREIFRLYQTRDALDNVVAQLDPRIAFGEYLLSPLATSEDSLISSLSLRNDRARADEMERIEEDGEQTPPLPPPPKRPVMGLAGLRNPAPSPSLPPPPPPPPPPLPPPPPPPPQHTKPTPILQHFQLPLSPFSQMAESVAEMQLSPCLSRFDVSRCSVEEEQREQEKEEEEEEEEEEREQEDYVNNNDEDDDIGCVVEELPLPKLMAYSDMVDILPPPPPLKATPLPPMHIPRVSSKPRLAIVEEEDSHLSTTTDSSHSDSAPSVNSLDHRIRINFDFYI